VGLLYSCVIFSTISPSHVSLFHTTSMHKLPLERKPLPRCQATIKSLSITSSHAAVHVLPLDQHLHVTSPSSSMGSTMSHLCRLAECTIGSEPKIRVPARWDHAAQARACQAEGAPSREGQKIGTGVPCHVARSCRATWHRVAVPRVVSAASSV